MDCCPFQSSNYHLQANLASPDSVQLKWLLEFYKAV